MESIWNKEVIRPEINALHSDIKTDVLIIGGGITGLLCAYMLKKSGVDCVLCEATRICDGITKNTTAKITCQHGLIYDKMIRRFGEETAQLYYESQRVALEQYYELSKIIECDFKVSDSYVYSLDDREKIEKEVSALEKIGCPAVFTDKTELPFSVAGAVRFGGQAQFHPLKFAFAIAKELPIFEQTRILEITPDGAIGEHGKITAKKIIVATHFPFVNKYGGYFLKMYQHRSYVIALKNAPDFKDMYVDESEKGLSFRSHNGLMLLGGGGHRTGKNGGNWDELTEFARSNYPKSRQVCQWATQDCMTLDSIPYIGQYSKATPDLYVATGFNKWGMTSSMVSAMILKDLICRGHSKYADIYSPSRTIVHPQLAVNIFESLKGLITPTTPRCPHMGCALKYNKQEHTWDCSCHGSRFEENGKLINNPATDGLK